MVYSKYIFTNNKNCDICLCLFFVVRLTQIQINDRITLIYFANDKIFFPFLGFSV